MPVHFFPRFTIIQKLIISFVVSGLFMLAALVYAVAGMGSIHRMQVGIARNDLAAAITTISLHEIILAQERLVGRYQILRQPEFRDLFENNAAKFLEGLAQLRQLNHGPAVVFLETEYGGYAGMAKKLFSGQATSSAAIRDQGLRVEMAIEQLRTEQKHSLERKLKVSDDQESRTVVISLGLAVGGV